MIVEYDGFKKSSDKLLGIGESVVIADFLSENPKLGDLVEETGGIRKLKWPLHVKHKDEVKGIAYYYYKDKGTPVYLIAVFKPGVKQALSKVIELMVSP